MRELNEESKTKFLIGEFIPDELDGGFKI